MKCGLFLDVVIRQSSSIFKLFSSEDQTLLLWRDAFLVLDLCLHVLNGVICFDIQCDGFSREGLDEDLHSTTSETKNKMKCGLFLDVVIRQSSSIFKLFSSEDQTLLLWRDAFLVLDLCLHILNGVVCFDIQCDGFSREGLDKDLHGTTAETENKMKR